MRKDRGEDWEALRFVVTRTGLVMCLMQLGATKDNAAAAVRSWSLGYTPSAIFTQQFRYPRISAPSNSVQARITCAEFCWLREVYP